MSIEFNGATLRVSAGYSLKVPAAAAYSSEDAHAGISVEAEVSEVENLDDLMKQAELLQADLYAAAKLTVYAQLGVDFTVDDTGAVRPKLEASAPKATAAAVPQGGGAPRGGGGQGGQFKPPADRSNLPVVMLGGVAFYDQRPLIASGEFKPRAASFRSVQKGADGQYDNKWLTDKDGNPNADVVAMMQEAGIA
jgi:hypothetical protein